MCPFPLKQGLSASIPNIISWPWSAQLVLQTSLSAFYMKTKWPDPQKPTFLFMGDGQTWVDIYCGIWNSLLQHTKNQNTSILIGPRDYPAYILKPVQMPYQLSTLTLCCRHHLDVQPCKELHYRTLLLMWSNTVSGETEVSPLANCFMWWRAKCVFWKQIWQTVNSAKQSWPQYICA